jgi:hypothetical protein
MAILAWFLKIEDEEDTVIPIFKSDPIGIKDLGGELMRITGQIIEEHHSDLIAMCLRLIGLCSQLREEALWNSSRRIQDAMSRLGELWDGWILCRSPCWRLSLLRSGACREQTQ